MKNTSFFGYGFEYTDKIYYNDGLILCKSINSVNPVYCSLLIKGPFDDDILEVVQELEYKNSTLISKVNKMAKIKNCKPRWQTVYYSKNLNFECGYESEGDENGDPR